MNLLVVTSHPTVRYLLEKVGIPKASICDWIAHYAARGFERAVAEFSNHYNHRQYHESLHDLPAPKSSSHVARAY